MRVIGQVYELSTEEVRLLKKALLAIEDEKEKARLYEANQIEIKRKRKKRVAFMKNGTTCESIGQSFLLPERD